MTDTTGATIRALQPGFITAINGTLPSAITDPHELKATRARVLEMVTHATFWLAAYDGLIAAGTVFPDHAIPAKETA